MSEAQKKIAHPELNWTGKKHSEESKRKMSIAASKRQRSSLSIETRRKIGDANRGRPVSDELRQKRSIARKGKSAPWMIGTKYGAGNRSHTNFRGEKSPNWIPDRSLIKLDTERGGPLHKQWSRNVKLRDGWKCKIANGDCHGRVESHHILSWKDYPELRYQINNGVTLCHAHHPRVRSEEKRLSPYFQDLVSVSK